MPTHSRGLCLRTSSSILVLIALLSRTLAQTPDNTTFITAECSEDSAVLVASELYIEAEDEYNFDNGLCIPALLAIGGDIMCTTSGTDFNDQCKNLDESVDIDELDVQFCEITIDGTPNNHTFSGDGSTYSLTVLACLPNSCANREDIQAYAISLLPAELDGSMEIVFDCTTFFDPVQDFWEENMLWILIGLGVLLLCCLCGFICCYWRKRQEEKDKVTDPTLLYGPNLAYSHAQGQGRANANEAAPEGQYREEEDEEEESDEDDYEDDDDEEETDEDEDSDASSYQPPESEMGHPQDDPNAMHPNDVQMQQMQAGA